MMRVRRWRRESIRHLKRWRRESIRVLKRWRKRLITLAKRMWRDHRGEVIAGGVAAIALFGVLGYLVSKRPGDVHGSGVFINGEATVTGSKVDWPTYGLNNQRTRFLPSESLRPPFKKLWAYGAGTLTEFSPVLANGTLYGVDNSGVAYALDAGTGNVKWKRRVATESAASPSYHDGRVFIVSLTPGQAMALDASTGQVVWRKSLPARSESSPAVEGGKVIFGCECGNLYALDEKTGKVAWQTNLGGQLKGAPAIDGGVAFIGDYGGTLSAVRISNGSVKWRSSSQGLSLGRAGSFYSTPAVAFGRVYIGSKDSRMYSFEEATGKLVWSHSTGAEEYAAPAVAPATGTAPASVYFGGLDGQAYALDAKTGNQRWSNPAGSPVIGAGTVIGQVFYVANIGKHATAGFSIDTGKRVFGIHAGAYNPVISDGERIYLTTYAGVMALAPNPAARGHRRSPKH